MKRNPYLRVKLKSLAEEARIIRREERRYNGYKDYYTQERLRNHRVDQVRSAAFHTLLAYQFLRNKRFEDVAPNCKRYINWKSVHLMIIRYGVGQSLLSMDDLLAWQTGRMPFKEAA